MVNLKMKDLKVNTPSKLLNNKKRKKVDKKSSENIESMTVDEFLDGFMNEDLQNDDINEDSKLTNGEAKQKNKKANGEINKAKKQSKLKAKNINEETLKETEDEENSQSENESESENENENDTKNIFKSHRKQLDNLKATDPEFYKFLEENDQELLNFKDSDVEDSDEEKNNELHKAPDSLEIASDESDYEPDEEIIRSRSSSKNKITKDLLDKWQQELKSSRRQIQVLREVSEAFHAALVSISQEEDATSVYIVEGGVIFNSVIRMCVIDFLPAVQKALKWHQGSKTNPSKCKNWNKIKPILKLYLTDLAELSTASSPNMLRILLKHIHQLCPFIVCFPSISPKFLKRVIEIWAMDEDVIKVLGFLCALRLANLRSSLLQKALKVMHLTYVRNTKFVSPTTLPGINFMRQSLCEMFALDTTTSYHMAFIYIRQLAINLRNAITFKKKESYKAVYNWAYVSSLQLWAELLGIVPHNSPLKSLIYPLVQVTIGTIKLIPSAQYFPLRFHCCKILITLSNKCGIFIPVLPFLLEVLKDFNFNKEHKKLSMKPMDLTCLLRCSKSQIKENGFKDALIENVYALTMEYLAAECHRVSFPDMLVPCIIQLKEFIKTCTVVNYTKKMKSVLDKILENSKFIEMERKKLNLKLDDINGVEAMELGLREKGPPFLKFYENWKKIHFQQQVRKVTNIGDFKLPVLYKLSKKRSRVETKANGAPELFPSDDEDSETTEILENEVVEPPKKRKKENESVKKMNKKEVKQDTKKKSKVKKEFIEEEDDAEDIITDLKFSDFN